MNFTFLLTCSRSRSPDLPVSHTAPPRFNRKERESLKSLLEKMNSHVVRWRNSSRSTCLTCLPVCLSALRPGPWRQGCPRSPGRHCQEARRQCMTQRAVFCSLLLTVFVCMPAADCRPRARPACLVRSPLLLLVSSEGRSLTSSALACTFARAGRRSTERSASWGRTASSVTALHVSAVSIVGAIDARIVAAVSAVHVVGHALSSFEAISLFAICCRTILTDSGSPLAAP